MQPNLLVPLTILTILVIMPSLLFLPKNLSIPILGLIPVLLSLSPFSPRLRYYLKLTTYTFCIIGTAAWGVIVSLALTVAGKREDINWVIARSFLHLAGPLIGWNFKIEGEEHLRLPKGQCAVFVGNHQSIVDILYLGKVFPRRCSIMAKQELKWTPILGLFMILSRAVFINRKDRKDAVKTFARVADEMKAHGMSLIIFAEGTRSNTPEPTLLPFKKGAFHLALQAGVPVIPIVCGNYHNLYSGKQKYFKSGTVSIKVLPPVYPEALAKLARTPEMKEGEEPKASDKVDKVMNEVRGRMLEALQELAEEQGSTSGSTKVRDGAAENGNGNGTEKVKAKES